MPFELEYQKLACLSILFIKFTSQVLEAYIEGKACTRCLLEAKEPKNQTESRTEYYHQPDSQLVTCVQYMRMIST